MSRDHLARYRAGAGGDVELGNISNNGEDAELDGFFSEVEHINEQIGQLSEKVSKVERIHQQSLNAISEAQMRSLGSQMDAQTQETRILANRIRDQIKAIEAENARLPSNNSNTQIRRNQHGVLRKKFLDTLTQYQQLEQQYRSMTRERLRRQYLVANPNATEEEVAQAIDGQNNGAIFAQELSQSTKYGEARKALKEAQVRHDDIQKIERNIADLAQLFQDMATIVESQQQTFDSIEDHVDSARVEVEQAKKQVITAIKHRKSARKKTWCLLLLLLILIIVIVLVVYFTVVKK